MRYDWIEDILAVIETGSFSRAADRRRITQSAFARRIDTIEQHLGGALFDRRRKPVALFPQARALEPGLRQLRQMQASILQEAAQIALGGGPSVTLACQHAITATFSPRLVRAISMAGLEPVRVRAGNRDECLVMLLSGEADLVVSYAFPGQPTDIGSGFVEHTIGRDTLLPVGVNAIARDAGGILRVVAYPADVFFGAVVQRQLWPLLPPGTVLKHRAETALTLAAYRYALAGIGVAWLPRSLVEEDLAAGRLVRVQDAGPDCDLEVRLVRLASPVRPATLSVWAMAMGAQMDLERLPDLAPDGVEPVGRTEK